MGSSRGLTSVPQPETSGDGGVRDPWGDNVARWQALLEQYPQACYTFGRPYFYGALRDGDDVVSATDLGRLIDSLLAREQPGRGAALEDSQHGGQERR